MPEAIPEPMAAPRERCVARAMVAAVPAKTVPVTYGFPRYATTMELEAAAKVSHAALQKPVKRRTR